MAFTYIAFFACIAVASAVFLSPAAPLAAIAQPLLAKTEEYDPNPQYSFGYDVQDAISGDSKNQVESRDGNVVRGQYSLNDADGYRRIVDYSADSVNGFNAVVRREPLGAVAVKTIAAAPALIKAVPAPLAYAAAPAIIKAAPALIRTAPAPLAYAAAPALIRSAPAPLAYAAAPALIRSAPAPLAYAAAPTFIRSAPAPLAYAAQSQTLIKAAPAPLAYAAAPVLSYAAAAPALLRSQTLIKSAPVVSYSSAPTLLKSYAAAPALTYSAGAPALVKTSFASPLVSYAY